MVPASGFVSTLVEAQPALCFVDDSVLGGHAWRCHGWGIPNFALMFSRVRLHTAAVKSVSGLVLTWVSTVDT